MHLFEFSAQLREHESILKWFPPLQTMFALKERNGGKLDSHLWFFQAFANLLEPKYCFLLDVGTMPRPRAICKLFQAMERNGQIAGCCGEIAVDKPDWLNAVEASQHFEYKMSHVLDKSTESVFGFISVLPGAFSAYRYCAIKPGDDGTGPLVEYFKSITASPKELGPFKANMYLAEDRILCYEIIARADEKWTLHYVKNAVAETDVPTTLTALVRQRRRWLNGSFFAMLYAIRNFNRFWTKSNHSIGRKIAITVQFTTYVANVLLNWFLVGTFYISFFLVCQQAAAQVLGQPQKRGYRHGGSTLDKCDYNGGSQVLFTLSYAYMFLSLIQLVCGLGNKPQTMSTMYNFCSLFYGMFTLVTVFIIGIMIFDSDNAAWRCTDTLQVIACNRRMECVPAINGMGFSGESVSTGWCSQKIQCPNPDYNAAVPGEPEKVPCCALQPKISFDCKCRDQDVGQQRFGDCQTACKDMIISPGIMRWATVIALSSYFICSAVHGELMHVVFTIAQYFYMLPTFINIFSIFSFCNVHDISWGTKGIESAHGPKVGTRAKSGQARQHSTMTREEQEQVEADSRQSEIQAAVDKSRQEQLAKEKSEVEASFAAFRTYLVLAWVGTNALYIGTVMDVLNADTSNSASDPDFSRICATGTSMAMLQRATFVGAFQRVSSCQTVLELDIARGSTGLKASQIYMYLIFGSIVYSLGLKMVFSTWFIVWRRVMSTYYKYRNRRLRRHAKRGGPDGGGIHLAAVNSPTSNDPRLTENAVAMGWEAVRDPKTGKTYFQNTRTNQVRWEAPAV